MLKITYLRGLLFIFIGREASTSRCPHQMGNPRRESKVRGYSLDACIVDLLEKLLSMLKIANLRGLLFIGREASANLCLPQMRNPERESKMQVCLADAWSRSTRQVHVSAEDNQPRRPLDLDNDNPGRVFNRPTGLCRSSCADALAAWWALFLPRSAR